MLNTVVLDYLHNVLLSFGRRETFSHLLKGYARPAVLPVGLGYAADEMTYNTYYDTKKVELFREKIPDYITALKKEFWKWTREQVIAGRLKQ